MINPKLFLLCAMAILVCVPTFSFAATTAQPTCTLTATQQSGRSVKGTSITVVRGDKVKLTWTSTNAIEYTDIDGFTVPSRGTKTVTPTTTSAYTYHFTNGKKSTDCSVKVTVVSVEFDLESLNTPIPKPTISGTATNTNTVRINITSGTKILYTSKDVKVKNGKWSSKSNKKLANGSYTIHVYGSKDIQKQLIASSTLVIGPKSASHVTVKSIPLLFGGVAHTNTSVPVAYIQVKNTGLETATLRGFTLSQTGTTPTSAIIGFSTSDDKGGSLSTLGGTEGRTPFKDKTVYVPLKTTILGGQMRIFTLKAILGTSSLKNIGTQLKINLTSIDTSATVTGQFPIQGTTWTLIL